MKKILTLGLSIMLYACALHQGASNQTSCPSGLQQKAEIACQKCKSCSYVPDPCREVLRPRITTVTIKQTCRACPVDSQALICNHATCPTFKESVIQPVQYTIPAMPEAYKLAAKRVYERIEKTGKGWCSAKPSIYVENIELLGNDLPSGSESGIAQMKSQIANGTVFVLAASPQKADYIMKTTAEWFDTPSKTVPALKYNTVIYDKNHNRVDQWGEIVKFADNQDWL